MGDYELSPEKEAGIAREEAERKRICAIVQANWDEKKRKQKEFDMMSRSEKIKLNKLKK